MQFPGIKEVGSGLRLEYAQYREMLRLTKLRTRLSTEAMEKMRRGEILQQILLQMNNQPMSTEEEIVLFYAFKLKILEAVSKIAVEKFIAQFFRFMSDQNPTLLSKIKERKELTPDIKSDLEKEYSHFFRQIGIQ